MNNEREIFISKSLKVFLPSGEFLIGKCILTNRETIHAILYGVVIQSNNIFVENNRNVK